jgi:hypothetical protein
MMRAVLGTLAGLLMLPSLTSAQDVHTFNPAIFRSGETLWVTTGVLQKGTLLGADADGLTIATPSGEQRIRVAEIRRVRRRTNGATLGTLIGLGVGAASGLALGSLAANEGGSAGSAFLLMLGLGAGGGAAVDGLLGRHRVIYERPDVAEGRDAMSDSTTVFVSGGIGLGASSVLTTDPLSEYVYQKPVSATHLTAGGLFRVRRGPLSAGLQVDVPQVGGLEAIGIGPVLSVAPRPGRRRLNPYATAAYVFADGGGRLHAGGGADVRLTPKTSVRVGGSDIWRRGLHRASLEIGLVVR